MAVSYVTSRQAFKDYLLRRLGAPVIDINVDNEQVEDRIDDALLKFRDYHYDGSENNFLLFKITQTDKDNKYITLPDTVVGVRSVFNINDSYNVSNMFNIRYQMFLNDLYNISSSSLAPYVVAMRHIETLEETLVGKKPIRFNRHVNKLHIDMNWNTDIQNGQYIIIDAYTVVDPDVYTDVWDDPWLKQYATALVKRQWGENLKKFEGMQLPGGVTFNGQKIWEEANEEVNRLDAEVINNYGLPVTDFIG